LLKFPLVLALVLSFTFLSACKPQKEVVNPEGAKQMLQLRGYEPNAKGYFKAIEAEDLAAIRTFFQAGVDPNATNERGETPLTFALKCCELKVLKALAEKVDLNGRNKEGNTALYLALKDNKPDRFEFLLDKNADVKVPNEDGRTVLHMAAAHDDLPLIKKLIERGADVNAIGGANGDIPLIQACIGNRPQTEIIRLFLDTGANVNHQSKNNATCLIYVAASGHKDLVQELLSRGADPKLKDREGKTARDWALDSGYKEVAALLGKNR
jgi:ankyrin repeat protein